MRADITDTGMLILVPTSITEESMLTIWFEDKKKQKIEATVVLHSFDEIGPECIKTITKTAETTEQLSGDLKKAERKKLKEELDGLGVDYNARATNKVLKRKLEIEREKAGEPVKVEKKPGEVTPPEKVATEATAGGETTVAEVLEGVEEHKAAYKEVLDALKAYSLIEGVSTNKVLALMTKYDSTKMSEVKEKDYPALLAELEKLNA